MNSKGETASVVILSRPLFDLTNMTTLDPSTENLLDTTSELMETGFYQDDDDATPQLTSYDNATTTEIQPQQTTVAQAFENGDVTTDTDPELTNTFSDLENAEMTTELADVDGLPLTESGTFDNDKIAVTFVPNSASHSVYEKVDGSLILTNGNDSAAVSFPEISAEKINKTSRKFGSSSTRVSRKQFNINDTLVTYAQNASSIEERRVPYLTKDNSVAIEELSSSIVLYVGMSIAALLIFFVLSSLWLLRRRKYCSKVYLSYELARPRSHISKPSVPKILPGETPVEANSMFDNKLPCKPLFLHQDVVRHPCPAGTAGQMNSCGVSYDSGIDNLAFTDTSSSECVPTRSKLPPTRKKNSVEEDRTLKRQSPSPSQKEINKCRRPLPRFSKMKKNSEGSPRVCSSDGSIFPASPSLSRCLVPPPPYSPSMKTVKPSLTETSCELSKTRSSSFVGYENALKEDTIVK